MKASQLIFGFALLVAGNALGQRAALLYRSTDIETTQPDSSIRNIWPQKFGRYMVIKYKNGVKTKVPKDAVWGFRDKKGRLYRMFKREPFEVVKNEGYVRYAFNSFIYIDPMIIPHKEARFSATLDSPIVFTKKKALRK
ncbi:hypothetical protein LZD49_23615 [Dyadobacter sp. CY261]|uniref:hypothetical protein n=1 Tax=Dyadobacter sp. CY261 TaxID=2907203 RepID=UPI001F198C22|nr:hypothetical protein [Dyadobacter sp. CY261]MCF0073487.1 hypothetical protein [Dyadobacter sp. CY261]